MQHIGNINNKKEWTEQVKQDLDVFGIPIDLDFIKSKSSLSFKNFVKVKARELSLTKQMEYNISHSKMDDLFYTELKMQDYLPTNKFSVDQARTIYSFKKISKELKDTPHVHFASFILTASKFPFSVQKWSQKLKLIENIKTYSRTLFPWK